MLWDLSGERLLWGRSILLLRGQSLTGREYSIDLYILVFLLRWAAFCRTIKLQRVSHLYTVDRKKKKENQNPKSCETWTFSTPPPAKETFCSESFLQGTLRRTRVSITGFCLALLGSRSKLTEDKILFTDICAFFSLHFYFPFRNMIELNLLPPPTREKERNSEY